jgi:signal transduction histidine kinase
MSQPASLRQRLTLGILAYTLLVSVAVAAHGYLVNERAERLIWESLLQSELTHFIDRRSRDPSYRWTDTETLKLFGPANGAPVPAEFSQLTPGVHDEIKTSTGQFVVLVSGADAQRVVMALDISAMENTEQRQTWTIIVSSAVLVGLLSVLIYLGAGRLVRPLTSIARSIANLSPDRSGQRLAVEASAPREAIVIADGLNEFLSRNDQFVERERAFVRMASHELRTPIAVICGSAEVGLDAKSPARSPDSALRHILRTARDMEQLVALLLTLAKDPARLRTTIEDIDLTELARTVVDDHRHLADAKELAVELSPAPPASIRAPRQIAQAAIGNLLRNAIENSDRGVVKVSVLDATVTIADPGHGMSEEEMSRIYTQLARIGHGVRAGIGLELIGRLCEHLGWKLNFSSQRDKGTIATLSFNS